MSARDPLQVAIKHAILDHAMKVLKRMGATATQIAAELNNAAVEMERDAPDGLTPRERADHARLARRSNMLDALARLEAKGMGRAAVMRVARDFALDRDDPVEVASLARNLRNWRRQKKFGKLPNPPCRKS